MLIFKIIPLTAYMLCLLGCPIPITPPVLDADAAHPGFDSTPTPDPHGPDAGTPSAEALAACANMRKYCKVKEPCEVNVDHITQTGIVTLDLKCMTAAGSQGAVRACGHVRCD